MALRPNMAVKSGKPNGKLPPKLERGQEWPESGSSEKFNHLSSVSGLFLLMAREAINERPRTHSNRTHSKAKSV